MEAEALQIEGALCPDLVPQVYLYDSSRSILAMQYIPHEHYCLLRKGLMEGRIYPNLAEQVSRFLAHTLVGTSAIVLSTAAVRERAARFENNAMCRLTEQVIFTDPYYAAPSNRCALLTDICMCSACIPHAYHACGFACACVVHACMCSACM